MANPPDEQPGIDRQQDRGPRPSLLELLVHNSLIKLAPKMPFAGRILAELMRMRMNEQKLYYQPPPPNYHPQVWDNAISYETAVQIINDYESKQDKSFNDPFDMPHVIRAYWDEQEFLKNFSPEEIKELSHRVPNLRR